MLRLPSFTYLQPRTLHEALAMKVDAGPDGVFVSGGTDLYPNMKRRQQEPKTVISLMGIPELQKTEGGNDGRMQGRTVVGSCITLSELSIVPTFHPASSSPRRCSATWARWAATSASTPVATTTTRRTSGARRSTSA